VFCSAEDLRLHGARASCSPRRRTTRSAPSRAGVQASEAIAIGDTPYDAQAVSLKKFCAARV